MRVSRRLKFAFTLVELLVVIAIIGILIALLLPAVQAAREAARRSQCTNNIKQLTLACHNYHDTYKTWPIGSLRSYAGVNSWASQGTSWIARILPYIEQAPLEAQIDWELMPQTGAPNTQVRLVEIESLRCPSDDVDKKPHGDMSPTNYVACIGNTPAANNLTNLQRGVFGCTHNVTEYEVTFAKISDGSSNTLAVSECIVDFPFMRGVSSSGQPVLDCIAGIDPPVTSSNATRRGAGWFYAMVNQTWSFSTLITPNDKLTSNHECQGWSNYGAFAARSEHPGGVNASMADGSCDFVSETIDAGVYSAMGTAKYAD